MNYTQPHKLSKRLRISKTAGIQELKDGTWLSVYEEINHCYKIEKTIGLTIIALVFIIKFLQ